MREYEFAPVVVDRFRKSKVLNFAEETYETIIQYDIFCTRFGIPYTGERTFTLSSQDQGDTSGIKNYLDLNVVRDNIQKLITNSKDYEGKTVDQIIQEYYGGQEILDKIIKAAQYTKQIHSSGKDLQAAYLLPGAKCELDIWKVKPLEQTENNEVKIYFQEGKGTFGV